MNQHYTEFKFPQIKPHPWSKVFRSRIPQEAISLTGRLLEYTPTSRVAPLEACSFPFFDELREPGTRLPNGRELPQLFNFSTEESNLISSSMNQKLIPAHIRSQNSTNSNSNATQPAVESNNVDATSSAKTVSTP